MNTEQSITNPFVLSKFMSYSKDMRLKLLFLRELIFKIAAKTEGVGEVEETLKWREPSRSVIYKPNEISACARRIITKGNPII